MAEQAGNNSSLSLRDSFRILRPRLRRHARPMLFGTAALLMKVMLHVSLPVLIKEAIDALTGGQVLETVYWIAGAIVAISLAKGVFQYWMRFLLIGVSRDVEFDLRNDIYRQLSGLDHNFYSRYRTGDIMARATNDLAAVRAMLGPGFMYWIETMVTAVLSIGVMLAFDWRLTLLALLPIPLGTLAVFYFGRRIHKQFIQVQKLYSAISSQVQESLSGLRIVRAFAREEYEIAKFDALNRDYIRESLSLTMISGLFMPLLQALINLIFLIVLWGGGYRILGGHMGLGDFVMFYSYLGMLVWPMIAFGWVMNLTERGRASLGRIQEILTERPSIASPPDAVRLPAEGPWDIEFDHVSVEWPSGYALRDLSLRIPASKTVAIVGHTGSGKTTLVNLIARMIDPTGGVVRIGGIDECRLDLEQIRSAIGIVPQETFLFSTTIAGNIAFGVAEASAEQIEEAATLAHIAPDVESFPDGFNTILGERGVTLSGGQRQRTAIARAVLRNPRILILDDALSSVDTETEERILRGLARYARGRTTILISHRVSTIRHADHIFVIENGELAEEGTHQQLLDNGGYYAELHQKQLLEEELEAI
jgi:ATP-binding cassette, subfamily B, multidrug efflux pump